MGVLASLGAPDRCAARESQRSLFIPIGREASRHMTRTGHRAFASSRSLLAVGSILVALVWAGPAAAQHAPPAGQAQQTGDKPAANVSPRDGCTDCRGAESARPDSSTVTTTGDGKTIVPKPLMRDQADFRLNDALKNVPGVNRR
jgi:outer membrane receptor for monomeric catechols